VRIISASRRTAERHPHGQVVHEGVRHVAIEVLPREVITFRTVCGRDIVQGAHEPGDVTECGWCFRVERMWVLAKATDVI
jgi:hypothetical protein